MMVIYRFLFKNFINVGLLLFKICWVAYMVNNLIDLVTDYIRNRYFILPVFPSIITLGRKNFVVIFYSLIFYFLIFYYFIFVGFDEDFILAILVVFFIILFYKNILMSMTIYIEERIKLLKESLVKFLNDYKSRILIFVSIYNSFFKVLFNLTTIINYILYRVFSLISVFFKYYFNTFYHKLRFSVIYQINLESFFFYVANHILVSKIFFKLGRLKLLPSYFHSVTLNHKNWFTNDIESFYGYPIFFLVIIQL